MQPSSLVQRVGRTTLKFCGVMFELADAESREHFANSLSDARKEGRLSAVYSILCDLNEAANTKISYKAVVGKGAGRSARGRMRYQRRHHNSTPVSSNEVVAEADNFPSSEPVMAEVTEEVVPFEVQEDAELQNPDVYVPM